MPRRTLRFAIASSVALAVVGSAALAPTAYAADPEQHLIDQFRGQSLLFPSLTPERAVSGRGLVSTAAANARIAALLPRRVTYPSVGRNLGVAVMDTTSGALIARHRVPAAMLPASNMKIVTAVSALRAFGPDKQFETTVASIRQGVIVLTGGGDATLGRTGIARLANQTVTVLRNHPWLAPAPGTRLRVFFDDSMYPTPIQPPGWRRGYEPSVVRPVRALGLDGDYSMDSARNAAGALVSALRARGIASVTGTRTTTPTDAPVIGRFAGATVADQVRYMLQVSENNVAEMLYRNVAVHFGLSATWVHARIAATKMMRDLQVPTHSIVLTSGSGVGRTDRLTPLALVVLLTRIADRVNYPELESIYYGAGLPLAGRTGTLSASTGRFTTWPTSCARGAIRAKTGTLFDTTALSGLTRGSDGQLKAFAILVNSRPQRYPQLTTRRSIDRIAATVNGCF